MTPQQTALSEILDRVAECRTLVLVIAKDGMTLLSDGYFENEELLEEGLKRLSLAEGWQELAGKQVCIVAGYGDQPTDHWPFHMLGLEKFEGVTDIPEFAKLLKGVVEQEIPKYITTKQMVESQFPKATLLVLAVNKALEYLVESKLFIDEFVNLVPVPESPMPSIPVSEEDTDGESTLEEGGGEENPAGTITQNSNTDDAATTAEGGASTTEASGPGTSTEPGPNENNTTDQPILGSGDNSANTPAG